MWVGLLTGPGDITIRWTRRSRSLSADSWGAVEAPLAEEVEAYDIEILDAATVKRVLSTATTSAIYTAADQTTDWGAPLGPGDTLDIRIFQLSTLIGLMHRAIELASAERLDRIATGKQPHLRPFDQPPVAQKLQHLSLDGIALPQRRYALGAGAFRRKTSTRSRPLCFAL